MPDIFSPLLWSLLVVQGGLTFGVSVSGPYSDANPPAAMEQFLRSLAGEAVRPASGSLSQVTPTLAPDFSAPPFLARSEGFSRAALGPGSGGGGPYHYVSTQELEKQVRALQMPLTTNPQQLADREMQQANPGTFPCWNLHPGRLHLPRSSESV